MKKIVKGFIFIIILFVFSTQIVSAYSTTLGTTGTGPRGIAIDLDGNIYTANNSSNNVSKITPLGVSSVLGTAGSGPYDLVVDVDGNVYTANNISGDVYKTTPDGNSSLFGATGAATRSIVIGTDNNIYSSSFNLNNVSQITPGGILTTLGTTDTNPFGITIDPVGNVYTSNFGANNVSKITPLGVSSVLGTTGSGPIGITIDLDGNIYTINYNDSNVTKITPLGVSSVLGTTGVGPRGIIVDSDKNVYVANYDSNTVTKITPGGVSTVLGTTGASPYGITKDSAGNIYTANYNSRTVTKITNPTITEVTPVTTPTTIMTPDYVFNSNSAGTITYGGSCDSVTGNAIVGDNTITFDALLGGTYDDCTITVTDGFGPSNTLLVPEFTIAPTSITITTPATELSYFVGEALDISGLVVTGTYSDASTQIETITVGNISGFNSSRPATGQVLTITFGGQTTTYTVDIVAARRRSSSGSYLSGYGPTGTLAKNSVAVSTSSNALLPIKLVTINLFLGLKNIDVKTLQDFLVSQNKGIASLALKNHGTTNYFGPLTKAALAEWQKINNISPAVGYFGPITRGIIKEI